MRRLCAIAEVSPKCYYSHAKGPSARELSDAEVVAAIAGLQREHGGSLGYRKMQGRLEVDHGIVLSRRKVLSLMQRADLLSSVRRRLHSEEFYVRRREMKGDAPPDLIGRDFTSIEPFSRFVCDITYLTGCDGTWYLSVIEDLFDGEAVGWRIGEHCTSQLCIDTVLDMVGLVGEDAVRGAVLHSDGGSTYIARGYRELLTSLGIRQSMGARLTCYDNARMESLNGIIKTEALYAAFGKARVKERRVPVRELAARVEAFIPYYNDERAKDSLGGLSPVRFRLANPKGTYPVVVREGV